MAKRRIFVLTALLTAVCVTGAFAQVTVSGGFALSSMDEGDVGVGANIYADFLLPVGVPLSLGFEIGYDIAKFEEGSGDYSQEGTIGAVPLLLRAAYHFDLMSNLDLYVVGKIGYAIGAYSAEGGVAFGFDVGAAYYFTPVVGVFLEAGFDEYALEGGILNDSVIETKASLFRFLTAGISLKL